MAGLIGSYRDKIFKKISDKKDLHPGIIKYLKAIGQIDQNTLINEATYVVFDTELTGLNIKKDSIVSIGALKMHGSRINLNEFYYRVVDPKAQMTGKSVLIHEITPTEASECPSIDVLLPEFLEFCGNGIIVGHFVGIDITFLNKEMNRLLGFHLQNPAIDTRQIYKWIRNKEEQLCAFHTGLSENVDLSNLAKRYSISVSNAHNALNDSFVTAQLFQRFINLLQKFNIRTVAELVGIGQPR